MLDDAKFIFFQEAAAEPAEATEVTPEVKATETEAAPEPTEAAAEVSLGASRPFVTC